MNLQNPDAISSNKLRKHIATVAQILNMSKQDTKQFSKFMGHDEKTHNEFYELPADIYQTAKVSKFLLVMERGKLPLEYKGKSFDEIDFDVNLEIPEEKNDDVHPMPKGEQPSTSNIPKYQEEKAVEENAETNKKRKPLEELDNMLEYEDRDDTMREKRKKKEKSKLRPIKK